MLHQIFHNGVFKDRVISKSVASLPSELVGTGLSVGSATAVCRSDEIVWLSRGTLATKDYPTYRLPSYLPSDLFQRGNYEGEKSIMSVIHWNIRTGVRTEVPLRNSKNKRFRFDLRSIPLMNGQSLRKNKLYWVESATGHIYATDITTGETEKKTTVPEVTQYKYPEVLADFTDTQIITMVVPQTSDSRDVFVEYFDKNTGKRTKRIVMRGLNRVRKQVNALPYGFTVNPEEK